MVCVRVRVYTRAWVRERKKRKRSDEVGLCGGRKIIFKFSLPQPLIDPLPPSFFLPPLLLPSSLVRSKQLFFLVNFRDSTTYYLYLPFRFIVIILLKPPCCCSSTSSSFLS